MTHATSRSDRSRFITAGTALIGLINTSSALGRSLSDNIPDEATGSRSLSETDGSSPTVNAVGLVIILGLVAYSMYECYRFGKTGECCLLDCLEECSESAAASQQETTNRPSSPVRTPAFPRVINSDMVQVRRDHAAEYEDYLGRNR